MLKRDQRLWQGKSIHLVLKYTKLFIVLIIQKNIYKHLRLLSGSINSNTTRILKEEYMQHWLLTCTIHY